MNELLIFTAILLLGLALHGLYAGFVKTTFTLALKIVTLIMGIMLTPHITSFLFEDIASGSGEFTTHALVFIVLYVLVIVGIKILVVSLDILAKLPVLKSMNRICGFIVGLLEGVLVLWIIFAVAFAISATPVGIWVKEKAMESKFLTFFYENNLIRHVMNDLFFHSER